jgi:hypothetical protein
MFLQLRIRTDFISGAGEMEQQEEAAMSYAGGERNRMLRSQGVKYPDVDCVEFGSICMTARYTHSHARVHASCGLTEKDYSKDPWHATSDDSLLVSSTSRLTMRVAQDSEELEDRVKWQTGVHRR